MVEIDSSILTTSADELIELVKKKEKVSIEEAAKALKLPQQTMQKIVDFLVEEKILGMEYQFTTPFIYIGKDDVADRKLPGVHDLGQEKKIVAKEDFYSKAKSKGIQHERVEALWKKYINRNLDAIKKAFYSKARKRGVEEMGIDALWKKYLAYLM